MSNPAKVPQGTAATTDQPAKRAAARNKRDAEAQQAEAALAARRAAQLDEIQQVSRMLSEKLRDLLKLRQQRDGLVDHLKGFYDEADKLAKGKAMIAVTSLVLDETNQIIRDAKALVEDDPYLDRVKEFVPAGDNPLYPDVVVVLRTVRQALDRAAAETKLKIDVWKLRMDEAHTVETALRLIVETGTSPTLETVRSHTTYDPAKVDTEWFSRARSMFDPHGNHATFDLDDLDARGSISEYFLSSDGE